MIARNNYFEQVLPFIDKPLVKVITGLRRSGKSSILVLLKEELLLRGVDADGVHYINFESFQFADILSAKDLYQHIADRLKPGIKNYLFLDEIQEVEAWEKAINSFLVDFDVDIYITGSNSHLLSSELSTFLTGRYVEFHIQPLSFREYLTFQEAMGKAEVILKDAFGHYLRIGGFPVLHISDYSHESAYKIIYDIYSSAILRDTVQRHHIRDVELLERIVKYVFDNVGNKFSAKNVADYFKSQLRKVDINTVYNYLNALASAFIIYRIPRYDVKGKEILKTQEKYFVGDVGLLYSVMGYRDRMISGVLENIVMLELHHRGYRVFVGKLGQLEIDFVAEKGNQKIYVQVAYLLAEESTIKREFEPLLKIKDHFPKYVVTMDPHWQDNVEGIKHYHIADFLMLDGLG